MTRKGVLGIVGCYGLSDQIIRLIDEDESIETLFVVDNEEGVRFVKKLLERSVDRNIVMINENEPVPRGIRGFSVLLWLNPEGLHDGPHDIHRNHREVLSKISDHVDSVFFCYGLCRSPELKINQMMEESLVPVTFLTDMDGEIVDDCFAAIIGGKKDYLDCIMKHKDTLLVTSGYAESWRRKKENLDIVSIVKEVDGIRYMFETLGYRRVLKLDDAGGDNMRFNEDVRAFSRMFDLELDVRDCQLTVFERSYELAKKRMHRRTACPHSPEMLAAKPGLVGIEAGSQSGLRGRSM